MTMLRVLCLINLLLVNSCQSKNPWKIFDNIRTETRADSTQSEAVLGIITRLLPDRVAEFDVHVNASFSKDSSDVFAFQTVDGKLTIWGNTGVSAAWGFHHFLKYFCKAHISWSGDQLASVPTPLPVVKNLVKITAPHRFRYYQNVCTSSYSFVWWDWQRWQREIDWMAMNGINLPLAFTAQETIWRRVYLQLGLTQRKLDAHFGGAAFLAWSRMGNMDGWGGPLPNPTWYDTQLVLQHKILKRMRSLGMIPVLPGFAGHIPKALLRVFPNASYSELGHWGHLQPPYVPTYLLDPEDPLFQLIGSKFIEEQRNEYNGTEHVYNADTFNEMQPKSTSLEYLSRASKAVYKAMSKADDQAIWLMQGWLFRDTAFWQPDRIEAYLRGVPQGKMIILDLYAEVDPIWSRTSSYYGQPFIWCMLHNFGGNIGMHGTLETIASGPVEALKGNNTMVGIGVTPEGIETNYILYDLMLEMGWRTQAVQLAGWVNSYAQRRYGGANTAITSAWHGLTTTVYTDKTGIGRHCRAIPIMKPSLRLQPDIWYDTDELLKTWDLMVDSAVDYVHEETFRYDLVDVTRQALQVISISFYQNLISAYNTKSATKVQEAAGQLCGLIQDMDTVLLTNQYFLLGRWLEAAKKLGTTPSEVKLLEFNARNQITMWGPHENIEDYGNKQWSGLLTAYYKQRWQIFVDFLQLSIHEKAPFNQTMFDSMDYKFEDSWDRGSEIYPRVPRGDTLAIVKTIHEKYRKTRVEH